MRATATVTTELQDINALRHGVSTAYTSVILDTFMETLVHL